MSGCIVEGLVVCICGSPMMLARQYLVGLAGLE